MAMGIFDASSGGNLLFWGDLSQSVVIDTSDTFTFPIGNVEITED